MILILTNSKDATADFLIPILEDSGLKIVRLNTDELVEVASLAYSNRTATLSIQGRNLRADEVHHIWYRRPERLESEQFDGSAEALFSLNEWSAAIEGFLAHVPHRRWMNHPSSNVAASCKMEQLTTAESLGFKVPTTLITQDSIAAIQFFRKCGGQTVVKPLSNGYVERPDGIDSLIYTNRLTSHHLESFAQDISRCPVLLQELVPKESDVRITVVDNDIHAVVLKANDDEGMQRCDIRRNNMDDVDYSVINLPGEIQQCVRELMLRYRLRFAAIDMAIDTQQQWWFFEINPNGQWAWLDILSVTSIGGSFVKAFEDVE